MLFLLPGPPLEFVYCVLFVCLFVCFPGEGLLLISIISSQLANVSPAPSLSQRLIPVLSDSIVHSVTVQLPSTETVIFLFYHSHSRALSLALFSITHERPSLS